MIFVTSRHLVRHELLFAKRFRQHRLGFHGDQIEPCLRAYFVFLGRSINSLQMFTKVYEKVKKHITSRQH